MANLFSEYTLKGKLIKNRLVLAPVVCFNYAGEDGMVVERNISHYMDYAKAEVGTIIIEATCVSEHGKLHKTQLGLWDDKFISGLSQIAENCKKHGSLSLVQIHHAGIYTDEESTESHNIFAPSEYKNRDKVIREITDKEIQDVIDQFAQAAQRCYKAGFDGVEIHAAHGYFISQFMSPLANQRDDEYGVDRSLFGVRVIEAIKNVVPDDFIIALRMGANDPDIATVVSYAKSYVEAGVDLLNISTGFGRDIPKDYVEIDPNYHWIANLGMIIKKNLPDTPIIAVFDIDTPEKADQLVKSGYVDFAASARGLLSDYRWMEKYRNSEEIVKCLKCKICNWRTDGSKCPARNLLKNFNKIVD